VPVTAKPGDDMAAATAGHGRLRASDADREHVLDLLKAAFVQGLLTKDEFDMRVGRTFASRTDRQASRSGFQQVALVAELP
jgi:hypothetical protein